ncbi:Alcohol dehydrogenase GroES domain protein [Caldivirga maquilingensis IC-167]|uniref:Alcohol dehydrogenase GroES domain protein n=2 Tax=Caldivirga maquilingensis TaxID=76887 RepID=A8MB03_CALMQ|nr:Alcohol dehydrogenase GroES domain protein [Caldivirga maquilingensis IC-167]
MWQYELDKDCVFHRKDIKEAPPRHVLIRPLLVGVCGTDKEICRGHREGIKYPLVIGHEIVAQVVNIAEEDGSNSLKINDRVVVFPNYWCDSCIDCKVGHFNTCKNKVSIGVNAPGALSEYMDVESKYLFKVPDSLSNYEAVLTEPLAVVIHAMKKIDPKPGDNILIIGGGALGHLTTMLLLHELRDKVNIFIKEINIKKVHILREVFGDLVHILSSIYDYPLEFPYLNGLKIVDTVGNNSSISDIMSISNILPSGIRSVILGLGQKNVNIDLYAVVRREIHIEGSIIYNPSDFINAIEILYNMHKEKYEYLYRMPIIEIPLIKINDYFRELINNDEVIKLIINPYGAELRRFKLGSVVEG